MNVNKQSGAVSLFLVLFSALLLSVIVMSFTRLMLGDQRQATISDVSQSAYDSAMAGVEDAKRAYIIYNNCQKSGSNDAICTAARNVFSGNESSCNALSDMGVSAAQTDGQNAGETFLQKSQSSGGALLEQAYTCVKLTANLDDYLGEAKQHQPSVVPMQFDSKGQETYLEVSWVNRQDFSSDRYTKVKNQSAGTLPLYRNNGNSGSYWGISDVSTVVSPLMEVSVARTNGGFSPSDLDTSISNVFYFYPVSGAQPKAIADSTEARKSGNKTLIPTACADELNAGAGSYACVAYVRLPAGTSSIFATATAIYSNAHFSMRVLSGSTELSATPLALKTPQVKVDSTGRASNVYRRVESRIELSGDAYYPNAALNVGSELCKDSVLHTDPSKHAKGCGDY